MNKISISDATGISTAKTSYHPQTLKKTEKDYPNESENTGNDINQNTRLIDIKVATDKSFRQGERDMQQIIRFHLADLLEHISDNHHQLTRNNAITIYDLAQKVAYRHSDTHPELNKLVRIMFLFLHDLLHHITREEQILFPNIKQLLQRNQHAEKGRYTTFGILKEWIQVMQKEHKSSCKNLLLLNELTNNYSTPADACNSYKLLFEKMKDFETDFLRLVEFENNILFTKALIEDGESPDISC
jgi:iron-sulfur cluster repair di-iron protein